MGKKNNPPDPPVGGDTCAALPQVSTSHGMKVERLFREERVRLIAYLRKLGLTRAEAIDTTDKAFELILSMTNPDEVTSLVSYLFCTARNLAFALLKRRARQRPVDSGLDSNSGPVSPAPEDSVMHQQHLDVLYRIIANQKEALTRRIVDLYFFDRLRPPQIAAQLSQEGYEIKAWTVRRRIDRILEQYADETSVPDSRPEEKTR